MAISRSRKRGVLMLGSFSLRVTPDMFEWVKERAYENDRSVNTQFNRLLEHARHSIEQGSAGKETNNVI